MTSIDELSIVNNLKDKNMQTSIGDRYPLQLEEDLDWELAYCLMKYLEGKIDGFPPFSFIDEISSKVKGNTISAGYGMVITKKMTISIEEPIRMNRVRVDSISKDKYVAYENDLVTHASKDIDLEKYPKYEPEKIAKLQNYLDEYLTIHNEHESNYQKTI